jgi:type IV pilus biogenesis protein CpaD/CtpE
MSSKAFAIVLAATSLAACQSVDPISQSPDPHFGEVTARNKAVQIINPDPVYTAEASQPGNDGEHAARAVDRYRKGAVKDTRRISTGASSGAGSSGGSSGPN